VKNVVEHAFNDWRYHAEEALIRKFLFHHSNSRKSVNIIILRLGPNNTFKNSRPCVNCTKLLQKCKIKINYVIFYDENQNLLKIKLKDL